MIAAFLSFSFFTKMDILAYLHAKYQSVFLYFIHLFPFLNSTMGDQTLNDHIQYFL